MIYAMSDIHGQYDRYKKMLDIIRFSESDHLYIIGDVIDRGPEGGKLLADVLTDRHMTLLLGNHELMMHDACNSMKNLKLWCRNGADATIDDLMAMGFLFDDIAPELESCPVEIPELNVDDKIFHLVHAFPSGIDSKVPLYMSDMSEYEIENSVWSRSWSVNIKDRKLEFPDGEEDKFFLIGHTPVYHCTYGITDQNGRPMISTTAEGHIINLDCGCARSVRLGCMNLNTGEQYYT